MITHSTYLEYVRSELVLHEQKNGLSSIEHMHTIGEWCKQKNETKKTVESQAHIIPGRHLQVCVVCSYETVLSM